MGARSNVLCTNEIAAQVHNLSDRCIGNDADHPKVVIERGHVAIITIVVQKGSTRLLHTILLKVAGQRDVASTHISQAVGEIGLLPLPPEAIQVGMMKVKDGFTGASNHIKQLVMVSICLETIWIGTEVSLTVPPTAECPAVWGFTW